MEDLYQVFTEKDRSEYEKYLKQMEGVLPSTLCFESIIAWEDTCRVFYQIAEDYYCIKVRDIKREKQYLYMPVGKYETTRLERLMGHLLSQQPKEQKTLSFCDVAEEQLKYFKKLKYYKIKISWDPGHADYIYTRADFENNLLKAKNQYNIRYFIRKYQTSIRPMTVDDAKACRMVVIRAYCKTHNCSGCLAGCMKDAVYKLLTKGCSPLFKGIIVSADGEDVGYAGGTLLNGTLIYLCSKNSRGYRGLNEYLQQSLLACFSEDIRLINFTEDMNLEGLRSYKMRLAPYKLQPKYKVELERLDGDE